MTRAMKNCTVFIIVFAILSCCCPILWAYTVTFDDIPAGGDLTYYQYQYGLSFYGGWEVVDHSSSDWGQPNSGSNVLMSNGNLNWIPSLYFGVDGSYHYNVQSVGAYFSTEPGTMLRMVGYRFDGTEIASVDIGSVDTSWNNHYAEISPETGGIARVYIRWGNSQNDVYHFCLDDLTVEPVPEPSSLAALGFGLAPLVTAVVRRRRRRA